MAEPRVRVAGGYWPVEALEALCIAAEFWSGAWDGKPDKPKGYHRPGRGEEESNDIKTMGKYLACADIVWSAIGNLLVFRDRTSTELKNWVMGVYGTGERRPPAEQVKTFRTSIQAAVACVIEDGK